MYLFKIVRIENGKMQPGVLNLTYDQIERWKNENDEWVLPEPFEIKNNQNQTVATVNPQTAAINDNEFVWSKEGTQQNPITLQYNENDGYYVQSTFDYPTKNVKIKQIDTSIIPSGGDPPITIDNVVLTENGQYLPSDFDPTTGQLLPEGQSSNAEYFTSVEVATNPLPLDPNQPPLTSNGQYTIYDKDADDDMDIVESNQQPQVQQRKLIMTRDVIDDQSYKNIGTFTVNVTPTPPITVNAIIEDNGTYSPNQFDTTTGELLPEGQTSNAQYINQVTVNNSSVTTKPKIIRAGNSSTGPLLSSFEYTATSKDVTDTVGCMCLYKNNINRDYVEFRCIYKNGTIGSTTTYRIPYGWWYKKVNDNSDPNNPEGFYWLYDENGSPVINIFDSLHTDSFSYQLYRNVFDFELAQPQQ